MSVKLPVRVWSPLLIRTVPVASGSVIVLSAEGSATVSVVSLPSSVAPSKMIVPSSKILSAEVDVVVALTELNVRVPDSYLLTSVCRLFNCCLKFSSVLVVAIWVADIAILVSFQ